jgi:hypothetical protein
MQAPSSNICVICSLRAAATRDHIPPRAFFKGTSADFLTVPTCAECNNGASYDDEDMRFFLSMQIGKQTSAAAALWEKGALKSVRRKASLRNQVTQTARKVELRSADGTIMNRIVVEVPARLYDSVFGRITRGLYFAHTGRILPAAVPIQVSPFASPPAAEILSMFKMHQIAGDAFSYGFLNVDNDATSSLWLYCFHKNHWVQASTGSACDA